MNVRYSKELPHAFVVGPADLKKLIELLQKRIGKVEISTGCADDLSREFKTLKDLITYENPKLKEILSIYLRACSDDYSKSITIVFRNSARFSSGISIDANGREDVVSRLKEEILDIIAGMRPKYDAMYRLNFLTPAWIVFGILFFVGLLLSFSMLAVVWGWVPVPETKRNITSFLRSIRYALYVPQMISLAIAIFSNKILKSFFPKAVFTVGQGKSRFEHQEKVRWTVIMGFWVSLAAGLVVPIITVIINLAKHNIF
jgi:hypothetical protein